jgi:hypothetical protein
MKRLRFYQIGDIHFPDRLKKHFCDDKDNRFPSQLKRITEVNVFESILRDLVKNIEDNLGIFSGILFCGDLTSRGDITGYTECVAKFKEILNFDPIGELPRETIHVVPGNHDIERSSYDPNAKLEKKFEPIQKVWENVGLSVLATMQFRSEIIEKDHCKAKIYSLNSCWGCSEYRQYPDDLRGQIMKRVGLKYSKFIKENNFEKAFSLIGEQLDSPSFFSEDLQCIVNDISSTSSDYLPIILTHHNLLPQSEPRLALYAELINAGNARAAFLSCNRPLIYLHGHIHKDPIEIISNSVSQNKLISISAPEFTSGYNAIDIYFSELEKPIGCHINQVRFDEQSGIIKNNTSEHRIEFYGTNYAGRIGSAKLSSIISCIPDANKKYRYPEILKEVIKNGDLPSEMVPDLLQEAEWFGLVKLHHRNDSYDSWWVERQTI